MSAKNCPQKVSAKDCLQKICPQKIVRKKASAETISGILNREKGSVD